MGKSTRPTDPFAFKPEYNNQASALPVANKEAGGAFAFKPEYNEGIKKKDGIGDSPPSVETSSLTPSALPSSGESSFDFLSKDIDSNDFFTALSAQTDRYFLPVTKERQNREIANATKEQVFSNPTALGKYTDSRIQKLREDIKDIGRAQSELVEFFQPDPLGAPTRVDKRFKNESAYNQLATQIKEKENYIQQLKNSVADVAADFIMRDKGYQNFNPTSAGRDILRLADPETEKQFRMAEKGGATLPGIKQSELERLGLNAAKNYIARNPQNPNSNELFRLVTDYEADFDKRNFELTGQRVREKVGAELYREGKSGFWGYSPDELDQAANRAQLSSGEQSVFESFVKPLEKRKLGTDIPGSGFFRSFKNAVEKGAVGTANTLADITGVRTEADVAQDVLNSEVGESRFRAPGTSPSAQSELQYLRTKEKAGKLTKEEQDQKLGLEKYVDVRNGWSKFKDGVGDLTGQVALIALTTKGLGAVGQGLVGSAAEGGLLGGMTRTTVGTALKNETVGLFINSYLNSYDNYLQQATSLMPGDDKAADRDAYAKTMAAVEGLSERIFPDTKILNAFTKGIAPSVRDISTRFINKEITQQVAKEELQGALTKYIKPFAKEYAKSTLQESSEEAVVDLADGMAQSVFGGQPFDIVKTGQQAVDTFLTTALYGPLVSGMAAHGAYRRNSSQNAFLKSSLYNMGANPAQYLKAVEDLQLNGEITQEETNEKVKLIKSTRDYLQEVPLEKTSTIKVGETEVPISVPMDYPTTNTYLLHRLNEGILQEKIDNSTDEVLKSRLTKELKRSQDIRKGLIEGSIAVTPDLQEVTDSPEKAKELGILDANQAQPDELIGTPFNVPQQVPRSTNSEEGENSTVNESDIKSSTTSGEFKMPQLSKSQTKEAAQFANELKNEKVIPDTYHNMITEEDATAFWEFVAQQAQNRNANWEPLEGDENVSEQAAIDAFGETIVDYAKELFPITAAEESAPSEQKKSSISIIQPNEISKPDIVPLNTTPNEGQSQEASPSPEEGGEERAPEVAREGDESQGPEVLDEQGAVPEEEAPLTPPVEEAPMSGITLQQTEETRQEFGLGDSYESVLKRDETLRQQADEEIKKGYDIEGLIRKIEKGTIPTDVENTILKKYKATLEAKIAKDPSNENLEELKRLVQATDKIGSETGRALRSRQGMELRDDSLAAFFIQDIYANLQAPLTEQQKETVIKEHEDIGNAQAAYDKKIAELEAENAKLRAEQTVKKIKPKGEKKTHEDYVKERKDYIQAAKEKLAKLRGESQVTIVPYANELFAIAPEVAKVVKSLVEEGVSNLADITKNVYDTFKEIVPELTETDVNNIISGEYNERRPTKNQISATLRDLRDEATLINKLNALLAGEEPKVEKKKVQRNQQIEDLRKKIKGLQDAKAEAERQEKEKQKESEKEEKQKAREANKKTPEQTALQTLKTRTQSEIKKLEEQISSGNFEKDEKKEPLKLDDEATKLKDKLIKLRQERQVRLLRMEYQNRSKFKKALDIATNILNVPRSLMATLDFSAPLRQAAIVTVSNPKTAATAGLEMFKQAFSQRRFDNWFYDLQQTSRYNLMQEAGLYVADPHDPRIAVREEQFMSNLAEKIPIIGETLKLDKVGLKGAKIPGLGLIKGSERAYVSYLNKMRVDLFNRYADAFENDGFTWDNNPDLYKGLATFLNNSTGRGDLGPVESAAPTLNAAFFSPRLMASRINILGLNPTYYANLPAPVRKEAFKSLAIFLGVGISTLALMSLAFGCDDDEAGKDCAQVELDPRSSDFGKIRVDKTRWDIWGGFQQYVRILSQLISGQKKSISGVVTDLDGEGLRKSRASQLGTFVRGKLAPVPSLAIDLLSGTDVMSNKVEPKEAILSRFTPLMLSDLYGSVQENGIKSIFTQGIPATFGVGVQNYLPKGFDSKKIKDPVYKFLYDKGVNLSEPSKKKDMSDKDYDQFLKDREPIIKEEWDKVIKYGIMINKNGNPTIDEDASVQIVPADKATYEQLTGIMKSISTKASREVLKTDEE